MYVLNCLLLVSNVRGPLVMYEGLNLSICFTHENDRHILIRLVIYTLYYCALPTVGSEFSPELVTNWYSEGTMMNSVIPNKLLARTVTTQFHRSRHNSVHTNTHTHTHTHTHTLARAQIYPLKRLSPGHPTTFSSATFSQQRREIPDRHRKARRGERRDSILGYNRTCICITASQSSLFKPVFPVCLCMRHL